MNPIRKYILELTIPFMDPRDELEDDDDFVWKTKKGVVNVDILGDFVTRYFNTLYSILDGVIDWVKSRKRKNNKEVEIILNRNLLNYKDKLSLQKLNSELRRLGIRSGEYVATKDFFDEARKSAGLKHFYRIAHVSGTIIGLATALGAAVHYFTKLTKSLNLARDDKATEFQRSIIFEGTILPGMRSILADIMSRRIKTGRSLQSRVFKIQDTISRNNPKLKSKLQFTPGIN